MDKHGHHYYLSRQSNNSFLLTCSGAINGLPCQQSMTIGQMNEKLSRLEQAEAERDALWVALKFIEEQTDDTIIRETIRALRED